ncbi:short chain dehydrogenase [Maritimibacter sp. 55A14]|uniref:SDR family oxidoreductase n=1 Tax=Maritimibacter sp. 55A14 TaxID=2174844 RepID=UPI000D60F1DA|nr:SDR family oxidoreductase [Maritimibacter sp. 55A14]PWE32564.1 short chain dehydrogenase [Maritimibacter sp. 55A14]
MIQKRALVTGAGKRLGRDMALALAARGTAVAVHYANSADEANDVAEEIAGMGVGSAALQADLLCEAETETLVERAAAALGGPLDILINNASIFEYDTLESATPATWDRHIGSNLRAPFVLTQAFARQALPAGADPAGEPLASGCVINMIDQRVLKPTPEFMTYTIAKMGLWAFTRTAAQALAPAIRVNAIGPGPTVRGLRQSEEHFSRQRAATVLGRGANPDDVIAAMAFILDAPALTGQIICMDGGQHLGWRTPDILGVE